LFLSLFAAQEGAQTKIQNRPPPVYDDNDGYEVLSVVLNARIAKQKNETVRISSGTSSGDRVMQMRGQCSGIPAEFQSASEDFDEKAKTKLVLRKEFYLKKKYELEYANRASTNPSVHPGVFYVGAVGFNGTKTRAIALVEYICGSLCGDSSFYFLRKSGKRWEEAPEVQREVRACSRIY
jgi:hypothetical protein